MGLQEHLWKKFKHDSSGVQKLGKAMKEDISIVLPSTCISEKNSFFSMPIVAGSWGISTNAGLLFDAFQEKRLFCFVSKRNKIMLSLPN